MENAPTIRDDFSGPRPLLLSLGQSSVAQALLLAVITMAASAFRFYKLGAWSFWGDEWISVRRATVEYEGLLNIQPLSRIATALSLDLLGISEWSARLTPAIFGVLTVVLLYFVAREMFGFTTALMASLLLAINPWHLYWSQNARFYTALLLFFTLALFLFYMGLERDRPLYLLASLFFLGLAVQERHLAAFLGPIAFLYVLLVFVFRFERPEGFRLRNLAIFFGPGILAGAWLAYSALIVRSAQWGTIFAFINNNPIWLLGGVVFYITIPIVCLAAFAALHLLKNKNRAGLLLALAATIPLASILVISLFLYTANRYVFISLTSIIILAAVGARELIVRMPRDGRLLAYGAVLVLLVAPLGDNLLYFQYQNGNRDDWKGAFQLIQDRMEPGDRVASTKSDLADFYMQTETMSMQYFSSRIDEIAASEDRIWFILDLTAPGKTPELTHWVRRNANLVATRDVTVQARTFPLHIYLYEGAGAQSTVTTSP
ncbi:MAG TPA: glycosyltransferase family 39 protein [Candidatus Sulfomarinibacteraceae bacterium]|nr:glycosyltransferase family 39 protein [Candidatus Sulfomarinibacteraceae bacterium]